MATIDTTSVNNAGLDFTTKPETVDPKQAGQLDKDAFLKLLAAQARYQDPLNPSDSTQQMAQLAQFSSLEQMNNVVSGISELRSDAATDRAVGLVGHQVTYTDATGAPVTGTVESVTLAPGGATLTIGGLPGIAVGSISEVR